jgi:hypothetical protein
MPFFVLQYAKILTGKLKRELYWVHASIFPICRCQVRVTKRLRRVWLHSTPRAFFPLPYPSCGREKPRLGLRERIPILVVDGRVLKGCSGEW